MKLPATEHSGDKNKFTENWPTWNVSRNVGLFAVEAYSTTAGYRWQETSFQKYAILQAANFRTNRAVFYIGNNQSNCKTRPIYERMPLLGYGSPTLIASDRPKRSAIPRPGRNFKSLYTRTATETEAEKTISSCLIRTKPAKNQTTAKLTTPSQTCCNETYQHQVNATTVSQNSDVKSIPNPCFSMKPFQTTQHSHRTIPNRSFGVISFKYRTCSWLPTTFAVLLVLFTLTLGAKDGNEHDGYIYVFKDQTQTQPSFSNGNDNHVPPTANPKPFHNDVDIQLSPTHSVKTSLAEIIQANSNLQPVTSDDNMGSTSTPTNAGFVNAVPSETTFNERFAVVTEKNHRADPDPYSNIPQTVHYIPCADLERLFNDDRRRAAPQPRHNISKILDSLLINYDKRLRPNYGGPPVEVLVSIHVLTIGGVSEVDMDYTLDIYLRQFWTDSRLNFSGLNESLTIGIEMVNNIWVPDTFFQNEKKSFFHIATTHNSFLRIDPKGNVLRSIRLTITANCPMGLHYFPLDTQNCSFEIESYGYSTRDIIYYWTPQSPVSIDDNVHLAQFNVKNFEHKQRVIGLTTGSYSRLSVFFLFERNIGFYLIQIYLPATLIVVISWVSFWLNRDATQARVAVGVTTVLTMTTLMTSTNASMPKVSYVKSIDIYLGTCFFFVFASLLEYATVGYALKWQKRRPPPGLHDLLTSASRSRRNYTSSTGGTDGSGGHTGYGTLPGLSISTNHQRIQPDAQLQHGSYLTVSGQNHSDNTSGDPEERRLSQTPVMMHDPAPTFVSNAPRKKSSASTGRAGLTGTLPSWGVKFRAANAGAGSLYTVYPHEDEFGSTPQQQHVGGSSATAAPSVDNDTLPGPSMPLLADARYRASTGNLWRSEPDLSHLGGGGYSGGGRIPSALNTCCGAMPRPSSIDKASRWGFPLTFIIFQCVYWTYYMVLGQMAYQHSPSD